MFKFDSGDIDAFISEISQEATKEVRPQPEVPNFYEEEIGEVDEFAAFNAPSAASPVEIDYSELLHNSAEMGYLPTHKPVAVVAPKESEEERVIRLENSADKELAEFNSVVDEMEALTKKLEELKARKKSLNPNKLRKIAEEARNNYTVRRRSELSLKEVETKGKGRKWFEGTAQGYKAMPHQTIGGNFMAEAKRTILGDEMGLGKTCTTMVSMDLAGVKKAVIITPAEVTTNFLDEVKMWSDRPVINIRGFDSVERDVTLDMANKLEEYVIVMNYEIWRKDSSVLEAIANLPRRSPHN